MATGSHVLQVDNLSISYRVGKRWLPAVRDFHIDIQAGQIYGLVGESGSGKSTVARGVMRYLSDNARLEAGSVIRFMGEDLAQKSRREMLHYWGAQIAMVPQNPGAALNPAYRAGDQVMEVAQQHLGLSKTAARVKTAEAFERVGLRAEALTRFPHELSGGQQQRVVIAMALITSPKLLILDEPTTNLDVTTEATILDLVRDLMSETDAAALYITHNLGVVAQLCDRLTIMYAGEIMVDGGVDQIFTRSIHPYSIGLLRSIPRVGVTKRDAALQPIPGAPPSLRDLPHACVYAPRCPLAIEICRTQKPPLESADEGRSVRCHRWREIAAGLDVQYEQATNPVEAITDRENLLLVEGLTKYFSPPMDLMDLMRGVRPAPIRAVDHVNLSIQKGRTLGLVGESGSGKSTLSRLIIGLTERTEGQIFLMGVEVRGGVQQRTHETLAQMQMVFQNPQNSLNPYRTVRQALERPLQTLRKITGKASLEREIAALLEAVRLRPEYADRYPDELSGGEKQRVAIARAFASDPALVICDEAVSALDVSVQAAVINLLAQLQEQRDTAYLFISHDLAVVGYLADYIAVMYLGELFEVGYAQDVFGIPMHPYTEALLSAIPVPDPRRATQAVRLREGVDSTHTPGCRFQARCPRKMGAICETEPPPWQHLGSEHHLRCHIPIDELRRLQGESH
jgi:peptide/nickel transport system ATP-binding protein